jgi:hypothetical protein
MTGFFRRIEPAGCNLSPLGDNARSHAAWHVVVATAASTVDRQQLRA